MQIDNTKDIIDSRDIIARIAELETLKEDELFDEYDKRELKTLKDLESKDISEWNYGVCLIRDSYFTKHTQNFAEDIGAIDRAVVWPLTYIDWESAAEELKMDYMCVDFDGVDYWAGKL